MKDEVKNGKLLAEGKTKRIYEAIGKEGFVIIESKDDITKNDDPSQTKFLDRKAVYSTTTTCRVFELLKSAGISVAYERQLSETEFLARQCEMIPLEVIIRRGAAGSYLKRLPNLWESNDGPPHRFHRLVFELFLKTTGGKILDKNGEVYGMTPKDPVSGRPIDDPLISNPGAASWILRHPKYPEWDEMTADLMDSFVNVSCCDILPCGTETKDIEEIARPDVF